MKKYIVTAILALSVAALAGCGTSQSGSTLQSDDAQAATSADTETESENLEKDADENEDENTPEVDEEAEKDATEDSTLTGSGDGSITLSEEDIDLQEASWEEIQKYGLAGGMSELSYTLDASSMTDVGSYYRVSAVFAKPVLITEQLTVGTEVEFEVNELTGQTVQATYTEDGILVSDDYGEYYPEQTGEGYYLYEGSADRVDCVFYQGFLYINKDAEVGADIVNDFQTISVSALSEYGTWYNGVYFDGNGFVTRLVFYGD